MRVLHSVERHCVCTAQSSDALCVLHTLEKYCVCTAQSREHCVCTAQSRVALYVYCTV